MSISVEAHIAFGVVVNAETVVNKLGIEVPQDVRENGLMPEFLTGVRSQKNIRFYNHIAEGTSPSGEVLVGDEGSSRVVYSKYDTMAPCSFTGLDGIAIKEDILEVADSFGVSPQWHYWVNVY